MTPNDELNKETEDAVYFFSALCPLDNFSAHPVETWGKRFHTAEHAYQWKKFSGTAPAVAKSIFAVADPHRVKEISRIEAGVMDADWVGHRVAIMGAVVRAKVAQNEGVREALRATGRKTIIENSREDAFWGIGDGTGKNIMGNIWMEIRDEIFPVSLRSSRLYGFKKD